MRALKTLGSSLGVMSIWNTLVFTGPVRSPKSPIRVLRMLLPPLPKLISSFQPLEFAKVATMPVTFLSSCTGLTSVKSMALKGMVRSCTRAPSWVRRVLRPTSSPSGIHPEVVMVSLVRVRVFSTTGMEVKG